MEEQEKYNTIDVMAYDSLMQCVKNIINGQWPITASMVIESEDFTDIEKWVFLYAQANNKREDYEMFLRKCFSDIDHAKITNNLVMKLNEFAIIHWTPMNQFFKGVLSKQEGGNHYKDFPIQPIEFIKTKNGLSFAQGNVINTSADIKQRTACRTLKRPGIILI